MPPAEEDSLCPGDAPGDLSPGLLLALECPVGDLPPSELSWDGADLSLPPEDSFDEPPKSEESVAPG